MELTLRVVLIVGAVLVMAHFIWQIRKQRLQIDYTIFWAAFAVLLVLMSIFPWAVTWLARVLGFESPANLVFLLIIAILALRMFSMTMKLSKLNQQVSDLAQRLAIHEKDEVSDAASGSDEV